MNGKVEKKPKEKVKNQKKKKISISKVVLFVFVAFLIIKGITVQPKIIENKDKISELDKQLEQEKKRADEVDKLKENSDSDEYVEKVAREKLNMIKKDEIVFIDITGEDKDKE